MGKSFPKVASKSGVILETEVKTRAGGVAQVVECLPSKLQALSSTSILKKKEAEVEML
jgi:hypothetical protein